MRDEQAKLPPEALRQRLDFDDAALLAECNVQHYKASGPGGQHRNKVTSAIRLQHTPSGLVVNGTESRSQHENRARALKRLREALALVVRVPLPAEPRWPERIQIARGRLRVNESNPAVHHAIALVLDALHKFEGDLKSAAAALSLTSSGLAKFLFEHPKAWREAQRMRAEAGRPPLRSPKG